MKQFNLNELEEMCRAIGMPDKPMLALFSIYPSLVKWGIKTYNQWAVFLGQCAHESAGFSVMEENLNYSQEALLRVWPDRFRNNRPLLKECTNNPRRLAEVVYGGRMGNSPSNAYDFRGGGWIQLTGRDNYLAAGTALGLPLWDDPELVRVDMEIAWLVAVWFFATKKRLGKSILDYADVLDFDSVTRIINGAHHGLKERIYYTELALLCDETLAGEIKLRTYYRNGSKGKGVKQLQESLKLLGYLTGRADGVFGYGTEQAVKKFQAAHNMVVDGKVNGTVYGNLIEQLSQRLTIGYLGEIKV